MSDFDDDASDLEESPFFVQSLAKGLSVITAMGTQHSQVSLADVARATSLTRATARRLVLTLERLGYVRGTDGLYSLTPKVLELGFSFLGSTSIPEAAQPHLEALSRSVGESTSASLLDGTDIVYVARVSARRTVSLSIDIGTRLPAYATAMGRVLLAALPDRELNEMLAGLTLRQLTERTIRSKDALHAEIDRVREQGWAMVDQEALEIGLLSIAAPVSRAGRVVAAINISSSANRVAAVDLVAEFRAPLLATARAVSAELEHRDLR
ncbi:IclR family transcriptional regulator domain-containing protein [Herbiconiux ginsengi]|uniref:Glycerol operon regulatory protein n=1 Tax=Herbiconiux ginsengi TaxID=381665 RepID=A0A1H3TF79_9MICO|nr:IclR family transcriptional regulator C-terminal domain-containing protein [Herbiconiux ginsengi]SDZ48750.1 transcriptional regulator, IclR family [Herbiconiux ginsengi]